MDKFEIKNKIEQEFKDLPETFVVNFSIDQHNYNQSCLVLLEHFIIKKRFLGLCVLFNKPYETLHEELKRNKLDVNTLWCIDCVSKETGKFTQSDRCFCLEDPSSLTELSLLINTLFNEGKIKFMILDSLFTMLLYNETKEVEKFAHTLITKARKSNVSVAIMSPREKSKEDILAEITQFCDKEIEL